MPAVVSGGARRKARAATTARAPAAKAVQVRGDPRRRRSAPPAPAPNTKTVTIIDGSTGKRQEVADPGLARRPARRSSSACWRRRATARIPRIAPDGARPAEIYARAVKPLPGPQGRPRIAIVIGGLGISANVTQQAMQKLPGAGDLRVLALRRRRRAPGRRARAPTGHEVLLQAPMEPFDYPDNDPGPQTLLTTLSAEQNLDRLHWLMSRFQGYVGITSFMGARFTATEQALGAGAARRPRSAG